MRIMHVTVAVPEGNEFNHTGFEHHLSYVFTDEEEWSQFVTECQRRKWANNTHVGVPDAASVAVADVLHKIRPL